MAVYSDGKHYGVPEGLIFGVSPNDELCIKNEELCIENEEFWSKKWN